MTPSDRFGRLAPPDPIDVMPTTMNHTRISGIQMSWHIPLTSDVSAVLGRVRAFTLLSFDLSSRTTTLSKHRGRTVPGLRFL